ncbi:MAG: hypothetical protein GF411_18800 [Candidatus Lokiarchaeota archaeon]|nr:hypothetical protein [Candidatus Lokiarchaeota archaeon]
MQTDGCWLIRLDDLDGFSICNAEAGAAIDETKNREIRPITITLVRLLRVSKKVVLQIDI